MSVGPSGHTLLRQGEPSATFSQMARGPISLDFKPNDKYFVDVEVMRLLNTNQPHGIAVSRHSPIFQLAQRIVHTVDPGFAHTVTLRQLLSEVAQDEHRSPPALNFELSAATVSLLRALRDAYAALQPGCTPKDVVWHGGDFARPAPGNPHAFGAPAAHAHMAGDLHVVQPRRKNRQHRRRSARSDDDDGSSAGSEPPSAHADDHDEVEDITDAYGLQRRVQVTPSLAQVAALDRPRLLSRNSLPHAHNGLPLSSSTAHSLKEELVSAQTLHDEAHVRNMRAAYMKIKIKDIHIQPAMP